MDVGNEDCSQLERRGRVALHHIRPPKSMLRGVRIAIRCDECMTRGRRFLYETRTLRVEHRVENTKCDDYHSAPGARSDSRTRAPSGCRRRSRARSGSCAPAARSRRPSLIHFAVAAPDLREQLRAIERPSRMRHEKLEQPIFDAAQADQPAARGHAIGWRIEHQLVAGKRRRSARSWLRARRTAETRATTSRIEKGLAM